MYRLLLFNFASGTLLSCTNHSSLFLLFEFIQSSFSSLNSHPFDILDPERESNKRQRLTEHSTDESSTRF